MGNDTIASFNNTNSTETSDEHTRLDDKGRSVTDSPPVYGLAFTLPLTLIGIVTVFITSLALVALSRTKKTPKNVRVLSTCLLLFDSLGTICFIIRRYSQEEGLTTIAQLCGVCFVYLAFVTVAAMSIDRFVVFQFPNFYIKHVTFGLSKRLAIAFTGVITAIYMFVRIGLCAFNVDSLSYYHIMNTCQSTSFTFFKITVYIVIIVAICCYAKIILIIRSQISKIRSLELHENSGTMTMYKSTALVGVFFANVIFAGLSYTLILFIDVDLNAVQLMTDLVNLLNNIFDTATYVLWFRECRMQILRIFSRYFPSLTSHTEKMKIDIFNVVTSTRTTTYDSSKDEHRRDEEGVLT